MSDQPPTTGFGFQPHPVVTVNVDTLVETVREGIPDDYLGPDPNDPMAGEKWGRTPPCSPPSPTLPPAPANATTH